MDFSDATGSVDDSQLLRARFTGTASGDPGRAWSLARREAGSRGAVALHRSREARIFRARRGCVWRGRARRRQGARAAPAGCAAIDTAPATESPRESAVRSAGWRGGARNRPDRATPPAPLRRGGSPRRAVLSRSVCPYPRSGSFRAMALLL